MAKPRILISTDAGGSDPDDLQSLVHAFLYADQFKLEGIISTPTNHGGRVSDIHKVINAYANDYAKLKTWSSDYPTAEYLKSVTTQGKIDPQPDKGWSTPSAGSKAIIQAAHESSEPLWVLCWGAMTDLAQALHDDPSIAGKIKVFSSNGWNGTQDPHSREYIMDNFKNLWWIESKSTHRGMWVDDKGGGGNGWKMSDADGHGALGEYYQNARPWGLKEGDTPSLLFVLKNKGGNPSADSWGGSFVKNGHGPNFWTDNPSPSLKVGPYNGAETIQKYQDAIYKEFAQLLDRAKAPKSGSGTPSNSDDPVDANNDSASAALGKLVKVNVLGNDKASDGGLKIAAFDATTAKDGKITLNDDGTLSYTPKAGYVGTDTFGYTAKDADGDTDRASVTVKVAGASPGRPSNSDDPVNANNDSANTALGKLVKVNVLSNDRAPDGGLKVAAFDATTAKGGKIALNDDGTLSYTPKAGYAGTDVFRYTAKDADGDTDHASVTVKVAGSTPGKPIPPDGFGKAVHAADDFYKVDAGESFYFNPKYFLMNDKGGDGGLKVVSIAKKSDAGFDVSWNGKDTAIYKLKTGFTGADQIDYVIKDKDGSTDTGTMNITVGKGSSGGAPKPPGKSGNPNQPGGEKDLVGDNVREVKEGDTYYFNSKYLAWNGKGPNRDLKVVEIDDRSAKGIKIGWDKDGTIVYAAKPGWEGVDKIGFTVQDNKGNRDVATIVLKIGDAAAKTQHWPSETMALQASAAEGNEVANHAWHPNDHLLT